MSGDLISREAAAQILMEKSYSYVVSLFPTSDECKTARKIAKECAEAVRQMEAVDAEPVITGETSDGYHTFNELYHHRAVLFSVIIKAFSGKAWKAKKHEDGSMYDGMFIVGVETPDGQATYHYDIDPYWEMFKCRELEYAPKWDGHTPQEAIERIGKLEPVRHERWELMANREYCPYESEIEERCTGCGRHVHRYGTQPQDEFCPTCGAKMDKEGEK